LFVFYFIPVVCAFAAVEHVSFNKNGDLFQERLYAVYWKVSSLCHYLSFIISPIPSLVLSISAYICDVDEELI